MSSYRDAGLFVLLAAVWGTAFVAIDVGLASLPPVLFAAVRYDVAGAVMVAYVALAADRWRPRTPNDWAAAAVGAALLIAAYNALLFLGQATVHGPVAAVLVSTSPILTTAVARVALPDERLDGAGVVGLALGFAGVAVIARPDPANLLAGDAVGYALVVGAAVSVAVGSVAVQRLDHDLSAEAMVAWSTALGAPLLHLASLALPGEALADATFSPRALAALAYLAVVASAFGYLLYFRLLDRLGAVEINLVSYAAPVFAALGGWLVLEQRIGLPVVGGFAFIFAGFLLVKRAAVREELPRLRAALGSGSGK